MGCNERAEKFYDSLLKMTGSQNNLFKGTLLGLRWFLATESPSKWWKMLLFHLKNYFRSQDI